MVRSIAPLHSSISETASGRRPAGAGDKPAPTNQRWSVRSEETVRPGNS